MNPFRGRSWIGLAAILFLGGCASTPDASSPVGMKYSGGTLTAVEAAPFAAVWRAAMAALNDAGVTVLDRRRIEGGGQVDGTSLELKRVKVTVRILTEDKTELRIRVDTFGDSELARGIYEKFKIALGPTS